MASVICACSSGMATNASSTAMISGFGVAVTGFMVLMQGAMVVDCRTQLVLVSGSNLSVSRPLSAAAGSRHHTVGCRYSAALLGLLRQSGWLLSVCAAVRWNLGARAGYSPVNGPRPTLCARSTSGRPARCASTATQIALRGR